VRTGRGAPRGELKLLAVTVSTALFTVTHKRNKREQASIAASLDPRSNLGNVA